MKKYAFLIVVSLIVSRSVAQSARIEHYGQELFLNGTNVAWGPVMFCNDINDFSLEWFDTMFSHHREYGANVTRWWIHADGAALHYDDDSRYVKPVTDLQFANLHKALDQAIENGVLVNLCLWSFDMVNNKGYGEYFGRHNYILTKDDHTQAYIDNWLKPVVAAFKDHPAVLSWEIYNEPEGMATDISGGNWAQNIDNSPEGENVTMAIIQRFTNHIASAIHEADPDAKVTVGSWSFKALTDKFGYKNFYSDSELISAGGKENGVLDFYQVHFYPQHFGTELSPFHHDASHWELEKPIVVGEFMPIETHGIPADSLFEILYRRGYAGAWGWTYESQWDNMKNGIEMCYDNHAADITLNQEIINLKPQNPYVISGNGVLKVSYDYDQADAQKGVVGTGNKGFGFAGKEALSIRVFVPEETEGSISMAFYVQSGGSWTWTEPSQKFSIDEKGVWVTYTQNLESMNISDVSDVKGFGLQVYSPDFKGDIFFDDMKLDSDTINDFSEKVMSIGKANMNITGTEVVDFDNALTSVSSTSERNVTDPLRARISGNLISFTAQKPGAVHLSVFTADGRLVETKRSEIPVPGTYSIGFSRRYSSGFYLYQLKVNDVSKTFHSFSIR